MNDRTDIDDCSENRHDRIALSACLSLTSESIKGTVAAFEQPNPYTTWLGTAA